jgi:E3 ubiquitin-protein ligase HECTD4
LQVLISFRLEVDAEEGFLAGLKIPAPWATGKTVESIHPVRDNYKYKETVHIPGARCLYLRFDSRSSTQYDYDKVSFVRNIPASQFVT